MSGDETSFVNLDTTDVRQIEVGNKQVIQSKGIGTARISFNDGNSVTISNVLYVPGISCNLLSVGELDARGFSCNFSNSTLTIIRRESNLVVAHGTKESNVYKLRNVKATAKAFVHRLLDLRESKDRDLTPEEYASLMHRRLGHASDDRMSRIHDHLTGLRDDKPFAERNKIIPCIPYIKGKIVRVINKKLDSRRQEKLGRLYCDTWGPYHVADLNGNWYFFSITDEATGKSWIVLLKTRDEIYAFFKR